MKNLITLISILNAYLFIGQIAPVKVKVTDFNNVPLKGEQIIFVNQNSNKAYPGLSNDQGYFNLDLPGGAIYAIKIKSVGDATDYSTFEIPKINEDQMYGENEVQIMIEQPKLFTLKNVLFDSGKSTLKVSSNKELDELVALLKLKPSMKIEIAGHTDNVGSAEANKELSLKRAVTVREYLLSKGISPSRITAQGYGDSSPVADNTTESGKKQNRRTEVRIL